MAKLQEISTNIEFLENTPFQDTLLAEPLLVNVKALHPFAISGYTSYKNNAEICTLYYSPVVLVWQPVTDAEYYIVQICQDSNFIGSTLRTYRVEPSALHSGGPNLQVELINGVTLLKEINYVWRVFAIAPSIGGVSPKSEIWTFTLKCGELEKGDPSASSDELPSGFSSIVSSETTSDSEGSGFSSIVSSETTSGSEGSGECCCDSSTVRVVTEVQFDSETCSLSVSYENVYYCAAETPP